MAQDDTVKQSHVVVSSQHDLETKDVGHGQDEEVFAQDSDGVNFRTVTWPTATVVFLKIQFAMSILSVPYAVATLGAIGGALSIVGWAALNTYTALILGEFRNRHPSCHMLPDMLGLVWGKIGKELVGTQILIAQILISAAGMVSLSTAFNALSNHSACTVIMTLAAAILITFFSSVRTFSRLGWLTWFGFATFFIGVFIFVVAVTQQDRPAAAPQDGPYELGYVNVAYPTFVAGITATANLFIFNSGSTMYLPVISEMRRPQDYRKACILAGALVGVMYLTFSLVIYRWTGVWLSSPAFNSAGPVFKKISWAFAVPGLMIGVGIYQHVAAKYVFVRALRGSRHLEANTVTHWSVWLGTNVLLGSLAFIIAEAVPILNYLLGLAASLCFAPFSLIFPCILWMYDFGQHRSGSTQQKVLYGMHIAIILLGLFLVVGGTYGVAVSIKEAFDDGLIPGVFSCADNSL